MWNAATNFPYLDSVGKFITTIARLAVRLCVPLVMREILYTMANSAVVAESGIASGAITSTRFQPVFSMIDCRIVVARRAMAGISMNDCR